MGSGQAAIPVNNKTPTCQCKSSSPVPNVTGKSVSMWKSHSITYSSGTRALPYQLQGFRKGLGYPWEQSHFLGYWVLTGRAGAEESFNISLVWAMRSWPCSNLGNYIFPYANFPQYLIWVDLGKRAEGGLSPNPLFLPLWIQAEALVSSWQYLLQCPFSHPVNAGRFPV